MAIVNDFAAFRRQDAGAFDFDGADRLAVRAHGKGEDCRRVSLGRDGTADDGDGRGRDALAGLSKDADVHAPALRGDLAILVSTVAGGTVATDLGIAGYSLDNGVTNVDVAARFVGVVVSGGNRSREFALCECIHDRAVLDDDVVLVGEEGADIVAFCGCADRHGRVVERDALIGIDAISNTIRVKGGVCDREAAYGLNGIVFLGVCLDLAAARNLDVAASPNRYVLDRACLYRAAALDGEITLGIDSVVLGTRGVDGASTVDVNVAFGGDGIARRCHVERARCITLNVELGVLVRTIRDLDALAVVVGDGVIGRVAHVELARGLDCTAVIAVELHIVGAVPAPGSAVARRGAGVVLGAADVDPFGGKRDARHEQRAHRERAGQAADDAAGHATPAPAREHGTVVRAGIGKVRSCKAVMLGGGRERGHGCSHLSYGVHRCFKRTRQRVRPIVPFGNEYGQLWASPGA